MCRNMAAGQEIRLAECSCVGQRMRSACPLLRATLLVCVILLKRKPTDLFCGISGGSVG